MKFIKTYIPMILSILFMIIVGFLIRTTLISETSNMKELIDILNILSVCSIIIISIIIIEVILYIIHAIRHKEIDCHILCAIYILLFNVLFIPLYNLKYVVKNSKVKVHMIIFIIISVLSILFGYYVMDNIDTKYGHYYLKYDDTKKYIIDDKVLIKLPKTYKEEESTVWDIYYYDNRGIEIGINILDNNYNITNNETIDLLALNISEPKYIETIIENKSILSKRYKGDYKDYKLNYIITSIKIDDDLTICVVQIINEDNYNNYKEELIEIINYIKLK